VDRRLPVLVPRLAQTIAAVVAGAVVAVQEADKTRGFRSQINEKGPGAFARAFLLLMGQPLSLPKDSSSAGAQVLTEIAIWIRR
jgi:hypothetical protein